MALVVAIVLPAVAYLGALVWWQAGYERDRVEREVFDSARKLSAAIDAEMRSALSSLETMRHSEVLQRHDLVAFAEMARRVHADKPHWVTIVLTSATGQQLVNLAAPPAQQLPNLSDYEVFQSALAGRASVSNLLRGRVVDTFLVSLNVPVYLDGQVKYVLGLSMPASYFQKLADSYPRRPDWMLGLTDQTGVLVARTQAPAGAIGQPSGPLWSHVTGSEGIIRSAGRSGRHMIGGYARSDLSGWTAMVTVPSSTLYGPRNRALLLVGSGGVILLGIGLAVAMHFGRRVVMPIEELSRAADSYVSGEAETTSKSLGLHEVDRLAEALSAAGRQQRQAAQALERNEHQLQLLVQGVNDYAIFMLDADGMVATWNTGAQRIKQYMAPEIIGHSYARFFSEEDQRKGKPHANLQAAIAEGTHSSEGWRIRKDGTRFFAQVNLYAIRENGELTGFAKVTRDITDIRQTEERLKAAREQLAQSQKLEALGQLTGGIAHDFNNIMAVVLASTRLMQRRLDSGNMSVGEFIKGIEDAAERAMSLVRQLLSFARRQPLAPVALDANKLVTGMTQMLRRTLPESVEIETSLAEGLWLTHADPNELENALLNLATNARDAMPDGGKLVIRTTNTKIDGTYALTHPDSKPGDYVSIIVTDSGPGMPEQYLQRAVEPFFTTKPPGKGTGLGLSQVHGFAQQTGGHVTIGNAVPNGLRVEINLPRYIPQDDVRTEQKAKSAPLAMAKSHEMVLIVEDDERLRELTAAMVRELGYQALTAERSDIALQLVAENPVAVLLADVVMPIMNGRQLADSAVAVRPSLKVLYMTGYASTGIVNDGIIDPSIEVLMKPFTLAQLARGLARVLGHAS